MIPKCYPDYMEFFCTFFSLTSSSMVYCETISTWFGVTARDEMCISLQLQVWGQNWKLSSSCACRAHAGQLPKQKQILETITALWANFKLHLSASALKQIGIDVIMEKRKPSPCFNLSSVILVQVLVILHQIIRASCELRLFGK